MADEFKVGDVVQLKSGGPLMTVTHVGDHYGEPRVQCEWFDDKAPALHVFVPEALTREQG